jgi:hypothetical protein
MPRSTNQDLFDRLRMAISALLGRPVKPVPAYAIASARRHQRRMNHIDR